MESRRDRSETFADVLKGLPASVGDVDPDAGTWPSPIADREWVDATGQRWHMRGDDELDLRGARRVLARPGVRVLHSYGMHPTEVSGTELEELLRRVEEFFAGDAPPMRLFRLAEFRNDRRDRMLVVEEGC